MTWLKGKARTPNPNREINSFFVFVEVSMSLLGSDNGSAVKQEVDFYDDEAAATTSVAGPGSPTKSKIAAAFAQVISEFKNVGCYLEHRWGADKPAFLKAGLRCS